MIKTAREIRRKDRIHGVIMALLISNGIASQLWLHTVGRGETWMLLFSSLGGIIVATYQIFEKKKHAIMIEHEDAAIEEVKEFLKFVKDEDERFEMVINKLLLDVPIPLIRRLRGIK